MKKILNDDSFIKYIKGIFLLIYVYKYKILGILKINIFYHTIDYQI